MKVTRRAVSAGIVATGLMPMSAVHAQRRFPGDQPIKVIVGFPAGGSQDNVGRILAERLSAYWGGAAVVVENVPGAGSNLAFDRVAKGPADGTQILIVPPPLTTNEFLYAKIAYDPVKDFTPLALVVTFPNLLCVRNSLPVKTMPELIAYAKANPGKLNYGSTGIGTSPHLASEMLKRMAGIDFATVHHRGSAPTINSLLSESVDFAMDNTTSITPHVRAGTIRALGITTLKPLAAGRRVRADRRHPAGLRVAGLHRRLRARRHAQGDLRPASRRPCWRSASSRASRSGWSGCWPRWRAPAASRSAPSSPPSAPSGAS